VSEKTEGAETGPVGNGAGVDPAAVSVALGSADRNEAYGFPREQRRLTALQIYAGKKDEAAKQLARAAQLDLTPSEKAEPVALKQQGGARPRQTGKF
jgi:hypothetical protein